MGLKWRSVLLYAGIALLFEITTCSAGARIPRTSARALAERTGAAHYEERYEKVAASEDSHEHQLRKRASDEDFDYEVYQGVVGRPGIDFPILPRIPQTTFSCRTFGNGYFADLETECQVFHICDDGRKISFLCPNGTIFQQSELICDWWFKVNCPASPGHYAESAEMLSRAQGRKHQPTYTKKVENEFYSNGEGYSRSPSSDKSQYPIKKDNRKFEGSTDRRKDHRYGSDEVPSLENFDFEDISDSAQRGKDKEKVLSKADSNDTEMQDVAESASFVGNNQRRNGFNNYGAHSGGQKSYDDRKGYEKPKSDRGRQRYRGDLEKPSRGRNQNVGEDRDEFLVKNGRDDRHFGRDRGGTTPSRERQNKKIEIDSQTIPGLIHQNRPAHTTRERPNTPPRRLDNLRTTPYYTPTVPTIRATSAPTSDKVDFSQRHLTTASPNQLVESKESGSGSLDKELVGADDFGSSISKPSAILSSQVEKGPASTSGIKVGSTFAGPKDSPEIISSFAVSGPPAATIPPQDYFSGVQGNLTVPGDISTKGSKGYGYQIPSQVSQSASTPGIESGDLREIGAPKAIFPKGSKILTTSPEIEFDLNKVGKKHEKTGGDHFKGYSYQSPEDAKQAEKTASDGSKIETSTELLKTDSASNKTGIPSGISQIGSKSATPDGTQTLSTTSSSISGLDQVTLLPAKISPPSSQQKMPTSRDQEGVLIQSPATPTSLVIGMRGTLPTDLAHKPDSSSPVIAVNILSDSTYSAGKSPATSTGNVVLNAIISDSSHKATTFKPSSSSSGPTYLPKGTTTIRPSSSGPTYLPKGATTIRPSSGGPTYLPKPTSPSPLSESISEHVQEMIKTLTDLKEGVGDSKLGNKTRAGLEIPPSSGPDTLHSLALYFAGQEDGSKTTTEKGETSATLQADISAVPLRNKTVQQYEALFGLSTTEKGVEPTLPPDFQPNVARSGSDLEAQTSNNLLGGTEGKPETRKIAQVFTNALSAYLEDPDSFRKVLTEVRPTEPPSTEENEVTTQPKITNSYFNKGTAASYLPTIPTTVSPSTTTEDLEVLDFSDVTISTGQRSQTPFSESTTDIPTTGRPAIKMLDRVPASALAAARGGKQGKKLRIDGETTTDSNLIAVEINKGLGLSTVIPYQPEDDQRPEKARTSFGGDLSTTSSSDSATTTHLPITFDLLPPIGSKTNEFAAPSSDILPPGYDDDEDTLQRAQSQSFVSSRNRLGKADQGKQGRPNTKMPGHYITRLMSDLTTTTTEHPSSWFLDPLTINDGLMDGSRTTTFSPYTYLPKAISTTTEISPVHLDLSSGLNKIELNDKKTDRIGKALPGIPDDLLPPENGMQRIANKVFGGLNETSADHLMNVMKKAEDNPTVRRLILLLIQTCGDDDYSKTVEHSRQALLNALIGMDENFALEDEIEVIKLRPKQSRRGKSIEASDQNSIVSSTTEYPVTTFRRVIDVSSYITTTGSPSTTDSSISTTQNPLEETTRFEIRVEDPEEITSTTATPEPHQLNFSTTRSPSQENTSSYNTADVSGSATLSPVASASSAKTAPRRRAKHLDNSLSQPSDFSHKSSDERALELLKSLYSLASKFGRR